ncbi:helix-turn-helix domain-containing protein [Amycolatopsis sp. NPDC051373]|uniref:helix-turn-helix domain-containing protein n=1 Tax=Amycolatopsis sp. NPDC051373 TaxID=3155801 RepID=UPI00344F698C
MPDTVRRAHRVDAVAQMLGIGKRNVRGLISRGQLRAVRAGRYLLVSEEEISRFLQEGPAGAAAAAIPEAS